MNQDAKHVLKKYYGYEYFRAGQEDIINSILQKKDTLAIMPTGAGKSICFQIPALLFSGLTLVISPLISLMKDQVDTLDNLGIPAAFINSTLSIHEANQRICDASEGKIKILYIAPERLASEDFCASIKDLNISFIAIDEAHCVSQWGHDFRPSYSLIGKLIKKFTIKPVVAAFTATATEEVAHDIVDTLYLQDAKVFITGFDRENLFFSVIKDQNKMDFIKSYIENNKTDSGIIYAATRKEVESIFDMLHKSGYSVGKYHAGLSDEEREKTQEAFLYDDIKIMVATNAFGMGIDKSNIRYCIHNNMTKNMESYYQEAGRAGRDGEPSECILLFSPQDIMLQRFLIDKTTVSHERKLNEYKRLQSMVDYCHTTRCLRKYILEYFGEENVPDECNNCSNCKDDDFELSDVTIEAQKIFSCVLRVKERYGTSLIADVLKGSKNKKVLQLGFDNLSTYGILKQYTVKEIKDLINLFIAEEYLCLTTSEFPVVRLTAKAVPVLKSKEKVYQKTLKKKEQIKEDDPLFEMLRSLRRDISDKEKVPPYIIFSDSTLREMCKVCPTDEKSFLSIKGVGEYKFEKYGDQFMDLINKYVDDTGKKPNSISNTIRPNIDSPDKLPSHLVTLNMYKEGLGLNEIASSRELKIQTIQDHLIRCSLEGYDVSLDLFIPKEYEEEIHQKIREIGTEKLKPLKDALPDEVDYMAIKAAICKYR